jgi:predicted  nucleic acid-binding Zn-ribbon protein
MANEDDMARLERIEVEVGRLEEKVDALSLQFAQVQTDIKKLGERYDDGMGRMSEESKDLMRRSDAKWALHDLAIRNHGTRIIAVEQRRSRRG